MASRSVHSLKGLSEGAVAPDLVGVGDLFFTSGIRGVNLHTGELPPEPEHHFRNAWRNLATLVESAGLRIDNIGLVTNFIDAQDYRAHINPGWLELSPTVTTGRPARQRPSRFHRGSPSSYRRTE